MTLPSPEQPRSYGTIYKESANGRAEEIPLESLSSGSINSQILEQGEKRVNRFSVKQSERSEFYVDLPYPWMRYREVGELLLHENIKLERTREGNDAWSIVQTPQGKIRLPLVVNGNYVSSYVLAHFLGYDPKKVEAKEENKDNLYGHIHRLFLAADVVDHPSFPENKSRELKVKKESIRNARFGVGWDVGRERGHQEDSWLTPYKLGTADDNTIEQKSLFSAQIKNRGELFAVADGMGGHDAGDIASSLTIRQLAESFYQEGRGLKAAVNSAERVVKRKRREKNSNLDTTLVAAVVDRKNRKIEIANLGDSRAYLISRDRARQITKDHTLVQQMVDEGIISAEEAKSHPLRNRLTKSVGHLDSPEMFRGNYRSGDYLLLCSDGLTEYVGPQKIHEVITNASSAQEASDQLVNIANERGGADNITALVVEL